MMDKEEIYALMCQSYQTTFDKDIFDRILWENINNTFGYYIVVEEHEKVIGFASLCVEKALHCLGSFAKIQEFVVLHDEREEDVATVLLDAIILKAQHLNCIYMELSLAKGSILPILLKTEFEVKQSIYHIPL